MTILRAIDSLIRETAERHSWLKPASEQVRRWKDEDALAGNPWGEDGGHRD